MQIPQLSNWQNYQDIFLFLQGKITSNNKIFGFDLDGTLTTYRDGHDPVRSLNDNSNNWQFLGPVKEKLLELSSEYTLFIITNQSNLSNAKKEMIEQIWNELDRIPFILCAHKKNEYRKPNTAFLGVINQIIPLLDISKSYFSGDAVGHSDKFPPYQWGTADYEFSVNCGFNFIRPIDLFGFSNVIPTEDLVIFIGMPGSGKTTFAKLLENNYGYVRLSQDEVGELSGRMSYINQFLLEGKKVVLDATFAKLEKRLPFLQLAHQLCKSVMIAWIIRNDGRCFNKLRSEPVSHFAYSGPYGYVKNFSDPERVPCQFPYILAKIY